jgi:hypothetical protein
MVQSKDRYKIEDRCHAFLLLLVNSRVWVRSQCFSVKAVRAPLTDPTSKLKIEARHSGSQSYNPSVKSLRQRNQSWRLAWTT